MNASDGRSSAARQAAQFASFTAWVGWALYAFSALSLVLGLDTLSSAFALVRISATDTDVVAMALRIDALLNTPWQALLGLLSLVVNGACVILVLRWLYWAKQRAIALGAADVKYSPWSTVLWYFVPFAQVIVPYWAARELWRSSAAASPLWRAQTVPQVLPLWWLCWVVANIAAAVGWLLLLPLQQVLLAQSGVVTLQMDLTALQMQSDSRAGLLALGLAHLITIGASLALLWVVQNIAKMQRLRQPYVVA